MPDLSKLNVKMMCAKKQVCHLKINAYHLDESKSDPGSNGLKLEKKKQA